MDTCEENHVPYELILTHLGSTFEESREKVSEILDRINEKYPGKKKGIFMPNDTHANVLLNLLFQRYGKLPETYQIIGFDDSPISREAVIPDQHSGTADISDSRGSDGNTFSAG